MKRWMVLAAVGIAGVLLALLLLPKPETGGVASAGGRASERAGEPNVEGAASPGAEIARPANGDPRGVRRPPIAKTGPTPLALENIKRMSAPDALYAGRLTSPLAVIRRQLQLLGDPAAEALGLKADTLIGRLREQRRNPEAYGMPTLIDESRAWLDEVKASPWGANAEVAPQFARFDQIVAEYEQASANPEMPLPPPGGAPPPPTVPTEGE